MNLYLINNVEYIVVFLTQKVRWYSFEIYYKQECASHVRIETANENDHFRETKTGYLIYSWSIKGFNVSVVYRVLPSLLGRSLKITVPLESQYQNNFINSLQITIRGVCI